MQRKTVADVLEPLRERLLAPHHKGWSSGQLVVELKAAGVPVGPARLRECLNRWADGGTEAAKPPIRRRRQRTTTDTGPITAAPAPARSRTSGDDGEPKLGLPEGRILRPETGEAQPATRSVIDPPGAERAVRSPPGPRNPVNHAGDFPAACSPSATIVRLLRWRKNFVSFSVRRTYNC